MFRCSRIALIALILFLGCEDDVGPTRGSPTDDGFKATAQTWVATYPTQCLTNDWEQDWLSKPGHDYADYPRDFESRLEIIRDYYAGEGVTVIAGGTKDWNGAVCAACSCPQGYTLYLRVRDEDVDTMLGLGYWKEAPVGK